MGQISSGLKMLKNKYIKNGKNAKKSPAKHSGAVQGTV